MLVAQPTAKLFVASSTLKSDDYINLFHGWIQKSRIDELLIDVHNYSHVPGGPGIILVAHESYHCIDQKGDAEGLWYRVRRGVPQSPADALHSALKRAVTACQYLEEDSDGAVTFSGATLQLGFEDRLRAPNSDATFEALQPTLVELTQKWLGDTVTIRREQDARACFSVTCEAAATQSLADLTARM